MPFKKKGEVSLEARVTLRFTPEEKKRLEEEAKLAGISLSALIRRRSFGRPILAHTDQVTIRELRRLGGLLKHIHNETKGKNAKETKALLRTIENYIVNLDT